MPVYHFHQDGHTNENEGQSFIFFYFDDNKNVKSQGSS